MEKIELIDQIMVCNVSKKTCAIYRVINDDVCNYKVAMSTLGVEQGNPVHYVRYEAALEHFIKVKMLC